MSFEHINFEQMIKDIFVEIQEENTEYNEYIEKYSKLEESLSSYLLYNKCADIDTLRLWQAFYNHIVKATEYDVMLDNAVCLIIWLEDNWNSYLKCILDETYKYMNVTSMVLESWNEFCR